MSACRRPLSSITALRRSIQPSSLLSKFVPSVGLCRFSSSQSASSPSSPSIPKSDGFRFQPFVSTLARSHTCGQLGESNANSKVVLNGFLDSVRDLGGLVFFVLRDRHGKTQFVLDPSSANFEQMRGELSRIRLESSVSAQGTVRLRPAHMRNESMGSTGAVEVVADSFTILNPSEQLPIQLANTMDEELRLRYRYLDLRRSELQRNLALRSRVCASTRDYFLGEQFLEIETPTLFKSTPEGAREFVVPTRHAGQFYALTQSPQQYKQLLMAGGLDRYFQIARCYRDESGRADRQPEFTQIDVEMSYVTAEDVCGNIERLLKRIWKDALNIDIPTPFPRMNYMDAMRQYGIDKPDTRFGMQLCDVTSVFGNSAFGIFKSIADQSKQSNGAKGNIYAMRAPGLGSNISASQLDTLQDEASRGGVGKILTIRVGADGKWKSAISKHMSVEEQQQLSQMIDSVDKQGPVAPGDLIVLCAHEELKKCCTALGRVRLSAASMLQASGHLRIPSDKFNFLWVVDFPLFARKELPASSSEALFESEHHPFTAPHPDDLHLLQPDSQTGQIDPAAVSKCRGLHYDVVLNGIELGGGSIRVHDPALQRYIFERILRIEPAKTELLFSHLLEALSYGCPPHGGIALGLDRLILTLCGSLGVGLSSGMSSTAASSSATQIATNSLRDVIAFPKSAQGRELMTGSPSEVDEKVLRDEYHLQVVKK